MFKYLVILILACNLSFSKDLVDDLTLVTKLRSSIDDGRIILIKRFSLNRKIKISYLGTPISPIFKDDDEYYIDFRDDKKCYRLNLKLDGTHYAKRESCRFIGGKYDVAGLGEFTKIDQKDLNLSLNTDLGLEIFSIQLFGITTPYRLVNEARSYDETALNFSYRLSRRIVYLDGKIRVESLLENIASEFGYLPKKIETTRSVIDVKENYGDIILQNKLGALIIIKRYQPSPLDFKFLSVNPEFKSKLQNIDDYLIDFKENKYCFMNDLIEPSAADCHSMSFSGAQAQSWLSFVGIYIDPSNQEIGLLR